MPVAPMTLKAPSLLGQVDDVPAFGVDRSAINPEGSHRKFVRPSMVHSPSGLPCTIRPRRRP